MAQLTGFGPFRHVRGEPTAHLMHMKRGALRQRGRGVSFWFFALGSNLLEVPLDDRELPLLIHGRSADHQQVVVQGTVTYRVTEPEVVAERVNFALDTKTGLYAEQPLEQLAAAITQLAQQLALDHLVGHSLASLLEGGLEPLRRLVHMGLSQDAGLLGLGIEVVSTRVSDLRPSSEVERALQTPAEEAIRQRADEATFGRRALAVEKERAIAENELQNRIELARREEQLIEQEGRNRRQEATEQAEARRIHVEARARDTRLEAAADAEATTLLEGAQVEAERQRMAIYRDLPTESLLGLAARELAGKLERIDHLNLSPEVLGPLLTRVLGAGAARLEAAAGEDA
jgi:regulator of protease activity HflC (stomatin/prohibitin superfamily)